MAQVQRPQPLDGHALELGGERVLCDRQQGAPRPGCGRTRPGRGRTPASTPRITRVWYSTTMSTPGRREAAVDEAGEPPARASKTSISMVVSSRRYAGRRHQRRHPRHLPEPPDHQAGGGRSPRSAPVATASERGRQQQAPVGHLVAPGLEPDHHEEGHERRHGAELALGEVEDAGRLVDRGARPRPTRLKMAPRWIPKTRTSTTDSTASA